MLQKRGINEQMYRHFEIHRNEIEAEMRALKERSNLSIEANIFSFDKQNLRQTSGAFRQSYIRLHFCKYQYTSGWDRNPSIDAVLKCLYNSERVWNENLLRRLSQSLSLSESAIYSLLSLYFSINLYKYKRNLFSHNKHEIIWRRIWTKFRTIMNSILSKTIEYID